MVLSRDEINGKVKAKIIRPFDDYPESFNFLSSGIVDLDLKIGGGWPIGSLSFIYGPQSSGKTIVAVITAANAQRTCRHCYQPFTAKVKCECGKKAPCRVLYIDAENYLLTAKTWVKSLGLTDDTEICTPRNAEEAFDVISLYIQNKAADLIILDSLAALSPEKEYQNSMADQQTALVPRTVSKFMRRWATAVCELRTKGRSLSVFPTCIFINQIREKTGVIYGNPEIMPGGKAQYFFSAAILKTVRKGIEMTPDKEDPQPLTQSIKYTVEKGRMCPTKRMGIFDVAVSRHKDDHGIVRNVGHIDNEKRLLEYAKKYDLLGGKTGAYTFEKKTFKTQEEIISALGEDLAFRRTFFLAVNRGYAEHVPSAKPLKKGKKDEQKEAETAEVAAE